MFMNAIKTEFVSETNLWLISVNTQYTKQFLENQALAIDSLSSCEAKLDAYPERSAFESRFLSEPKIKSMFGNKRRLKQEAVNAYAWIYEIKLGDWVLMTSSTAFYLGVVTSPVLTASHPKLKRNYVRSIEWCTVRAQRKDLDAEVQHYLSLGTIAKAERDCAASAFLYVLQEAKDWSQPLVNKMVALFKPESFKHCLTKQYALYRQTHRAELTVDGSQGTTQTTVDLSSSPEATHKVNHDAEAVVSSQSVTHKLDNKAEDESLSLGVTHEAEQKVEAVSETPNQALSSPTEVESPVEKPSVDTNHLSVDVVCKTQESDAVALTSQEINAICCKSQASDNQVLDDVLEEVFEEWELLEEPAESSSNINQIVQRMHEAFDGRLAYLVREILQVQGMQIERMDECKAGCLIVASSAVDQARYCVLVCELYCDHSAWEELGRIAENNQAAQSLLIAWGGLSGQIEPKQFMQTHVCTELDMAKKFLDSYPFLSDETRQRLPVRKLWHLVKNR